MALGGVKMTDTDGNIGVLTSNLSETVCGLLFDISAQNDFWTSTTGTKLAPLFKDTVVEFNSLSEVKDAGIVPFTSGGDNVLQGVPYYHIDHFFKLNGGTGRLFVAFADCSQGWDTIYLMQNEANGQINQFGVWTEQSLWKETAEDADRYGVNLVGDLQLIGNELANEYYAPAVILLNANSAKVKTDSGTSDKVVLSKIPSCDVDCRYVSVLLGQGRETQVAEMQTALDSKTPVGNVGAALGCLARCNVSQNIGYVAANALQAYFPDVEFGFGDVTDAGGKLTNTTSYSSLKKRQLDELDDKGYVFLVKYPGLEGKVYFNDDKTCSNGDFRTISRNRVINKSRRSVRQVLLPYVNAPLRIDPSTGQLSAAQITVFTNLVSDVLKAMDTAEEISGVGSVTIPAKQNILKNDTLLIDYRIVPMGTAKLITVTEGFSVTASTTKK